APAQYIATADLCARVLLWGAVIELCASVLFYESLFQSMDHHLNLWTFILIYGPLSCPMFLHPVLRAVFLFLCSINFSSFLYAVIGFYGSLFQSMGLCSGLCAFISFYELLS